jgi:hypothetical protein
MYLIAKSFQNREAAKVPLSVSMFWEGYHAILPTVPHNRTETQTLV